MEVLLHSKGFGIGLARVLGLAVLLAGVRLAGAQTSEADVLHTEDQVLKEQLAVAAVAHRGKVALFATQLNTGRTVALDPDVPVQTASVIKLTILFEAMEQVRAGKAKWDEKILLAPGDGVGGSGMLHFFDTPLTLTLKDVLTMMVIVSDNTATNLMIDRFTTKAVNDRMISLGLPDTVLYKKVFAPATEPMAADQPKFGLGKTTARQIATVIERIGRCDLGSTSAKDAQMAACAVALKMLKNQFYREGIARYLDHADPEPAVSGEAVASKSGALDATRSDVAIIASKSGPIVLAIYTYENADHGWTVDMEAQTTMAKIAQAVVGMWSPSGVNGNLLVTGLGLDTTAPLPVRP